MGANDREPRDSAPAIRRADPKDAVDVARLLHDFNSEYEEPTPGIEALTERGRRMLAEGEMTVLLAGEPPHGLTMIRLRPSIWTGALDAYLEELYVAPPHRGEGSGRALLEGAMDVARRAGAAHIDLGTSEDDTAARGLYESCGFTNREGGPDGPAMLFYEREL
jgi:GNAT superfamily N-acetyltransferase